MWTLRRSGQVAVLMNYGFFFGKMGIIFHGAVRSGKEVRGQ